MTKYQVNQEVEILRPDFHTPGFPETWFRGVVRHVETFESGHSDLTIESDGRQTVERVGTRGGSRRVRPVEYINVPAITNSWYIEAAS